jgi:hypothetical protein
MIEEITRLYRQASQLSVHVEPVELLHAKSEVCSVF